MPHSEPLRPEQRAALDYARRAGSEAPRSAILRRLETTFAELDRELAAVVPQAAAWSPGPGQWSVRDVVDHLVVSHERAARQLGELVAGREPEGGPVPAGLRSPRPPASTWSELRADLQRTHAGFLQLVADTPEETPLTVRAPVEMVVKCAVEGGAVEGVAAGGIAVEPVHWIESFDWKAFAVLYRAHALEHLQQVRRILAARGG